MALRDLPPQPPDIHTDLTLDNFCDKGSRTFNRDYIGLQINLGTLLAVDTKYHKIAENCINVLPRSSGCSKSKSRCPQGHVPSETYRESALGSSWCLVVAQQPLVSLAWSVSAPPTVLTQPSPVCHCLHVAIFL
jgi:hypothetical protein